MLSAGPQRRTDVIDHQGVAVSIQVSVDFTMTGDLTLFSPKTVGWLYSPEMLRGVLIITIGLRAWLNPTGTNLASIGGKAPRLWSNALRRT